MSRYNLINEPYSASERKACSMEFLMTRNGARRGALSTLHTLIERGDADDLRAGVLDLISLLLEETPG